MRLKSVGDLQSDFDERFPDLVSQLSTARTRRLVRLSLQQAGRGDGNHGGRHGVTLTMAERYVEQVIGSIRRERRDHVVIFNESHLRRVLSSLRRLLPSNEDASCTQQGLPGPSPHPATQNRKSCGHPAGRRSASSLRTPRRLTPRTVPADRRLFRSR